MEEFKVEYINPFMLGAMSVADTVAQVRLSPGKPSIAKLGFDDSHVLIMLGLTGEMQGQIILDFTVEKACSMASAMMMGMPVTDLDEMSLSAISEFGNMVMGTAATKLAANGIVTDITPPTVARGNIEFNTTYAHNICVPLLDPDGEVFLKINVALKMSDEK